MLKIGSLMGRFYFSTSRDIALVCADEMLLATADGNRLIGIF